MNFCKLLNDNLCFDDVSCAIRMFGEEELPFFDGVSPTGNNIAINKRRQSSTMDHCRLLKPKNNLNLCN